jgi:hypothetical protein
MPLSLPQNYREILIGLAALRDDPPLRMRFAAAARERAELEFGHDRMLDRMEAVFRRVLGER